MRTRFTARRRGRAFTLLELIVVVLVLAVLAGISTVAYNQFVGKSSQAQAQASATALRDALQARASTEDVSVAELAEHLWAGSDPLAGLSTEFTGTVEYKPADGADPASLRVTGVGQKHSACIDLPTNARVVPPVYNCTPGADSGIVTTPPEEPGDDDGDFNSEAPQTPPALQPGDGPVEDSFNAVGDLDGQPVGETGFVWQALRGSWVGDGSAASTTTPADQNPLLVTDLGTPDVDVSLSMFDGENGADALYFRVQDADNWWRVRQNTVTESVAMYGPWRGTGWQFVSRYSCSVKADGYYNYVEGVPTRWVEGWMDKWDQIMCDEWKQSVTRDELGIQDVYRLSLVLEKSVDGLIGEAASWGVDSFDAVRIVADSNTVSVYSPNSTLLGAVTDSTFNDATMFGVGLGGTGTGSNLHNFIANAVN